MSTEWSAAQVRSAFLEYFIERRGHQQVPSAAVLPHDDPTLLFVNSGMCQFKPVFLGTIDPSTPMAQLKRACNSQKCIRAGGKHNDLDDVGKDTYHHTFFEMLGNWSFGDFFKKEAIDWSWELLTSVYGLDPNRLYATYFEGSDDVEADLEAKALWGQYLPEERILPGDTKDNFWEMGATGPCGPCSELHYDRIGGRCVPELVNKDDPNVIEIWNLVFMQQNREPDGSLRPLPNKHIDTGMGLERLVSILQNTPSNYDTDVFTPIFERILAVTEAPRPYGGKVGSDDDGVDMAYRVVADHVRNLCIAIADGILPGNEGRNYVLRRILRRAVRYGKQFLNARVGFLEQLIPAVLQTLGDAFPELVKEQERITSVLRDEEESFSRTLENGISMFHKFEQETKTQRNTVLSGEHVFMLYDTFGFPSDLTEILAHENGLEVDLEGFEQALEEARQRSRNVQGSEALRPKFEAEEVAALKSLNIETTDDIHKYTWGTPLSCVVSAMHTGEGFQQGTDHGHVGIILDQSPFYAESGGQVADSGVLELPNGSSIAVTDVQSYGGYLVHYVDVDNARVSVGDTIVAKVDYERRSCIAPNHTCTHATNFALRKVLKTDVDQMGSLVDQDKLRFDFGLNRGLKKKEVEQIESIVSNLVAQEVPVYNTVASLSQAQSICSLRAVFGEQYPDPVRVVSIGQPIEEMLQNPDEAKWFDYSVEFCGGTHLSNMKQASGYVIISEEGIAKGVRRLVAYTGKAAAKARDTAAALSKSLSELEKAKDASKGLIEFRKDLSATRIPLLDRLSFTQRVDALAKKIAKGAKSKSKGNIGAAITLAKEQAAASIEARSPCCVCRVDIGLDTKALKEAVAKTLESYPEIVIALFSFDSNKGKMAAYFGVPKSLQSSSFDANIWLKGTLSPFGGKGGGKKDMAQGQASLPEDKADEVMEAAKNVAMQHVR